jgi:hypothetical protein
VNHNHTFRFVSVLLALSTVAASLRAQYAPPVLAAPFPGYINNYLRNSDPYMNAWDIGINARGRFEDKDGAGFDYTGSNADFRLTGNGLTNDNNNKYYLTRIMPRVGYTAKWVSFLVEGRSSASYGDNRGDILVPADANKPGRSLPEEDSDLNLHQAYLLVGNHKEFPLSLKIGRQELVYGDQRLLGNFRWNNNARTFDAAKLRWQNKFFGVDVFTGGLVYNDDHNFNRSHIGADNFSGAYFNFPRISHNNIVESYLYSRNVTVRSATVDVDPFKNPYAGVAAPFRNPPKQDLYTAGLRIKSKPNAYGPWDYCMELMHQFGDRATTGPTALSAAVAVAPRLRQDANAAVVQGGYTWTESTWQPRIGLIYSYASGSKNAAGSTSQTFQNMFATTHLHYGYMDLNSLQNLDDIRLACTCKPTATTSVALEGHLQYLDKTSDSWYNVAGVARTGGTANAGNGYAISPSFSHDLGKEVDIVMSWNILPSTQLEVDVSHYYRGDYIKQSLRIPGSKDASYCYVQLTLNL